MWILLLLALQVAPAPEPSSAPLCAPVPEQQQIHWQRSLEDAQALSRAQGRPILIAINMDGESASENIVRERYRDPKFVALTRRFVCLGASAFRHGERDHTYDGRRLLSPRLGAITSGEAMALEPILYDAYLGGERIAPRHALILPDGTKIFDVFQLFDLRELDRLLEDAQKLAPPATEPDHGPVDASRLTRDGWLKLASAVDNRERARFEALLAAPAPLEHLEAGLDALAQVANVGSIEALRIAFGRAAEAPERIVPLATKVALTRKLEIPAAALLRELLSDVPEHCAAASPTARGELIEAFARLGGAQGANRSLLLSYLAASELAPEQLVRLCPSDSWSAVGDVIRESNGRMRPAAALAVARSVVREAPWRAPDERGSEEVTEAELQAADEHLAAHRDDVQAQRRFGKAALLAARLRIEIQGPSVGLLLEDSARALEQAILANPSDIESWLLLARAAYLRSDFEAQERAGLGALAAMPKLDSGSVSCLLGRVARTPGEIAAAARAVAQPLERLEAMRWLADGCARLLGVRSGGNVVVELTGMLRGYGAATLAVQSPLATATDWLTLSAFHAALGRRAEEIAVARAGLDVFPDAQELRNAYYLAVWERGYSAEARRQSEALADLHPESGAARWYIGYAAMHEGNTLRRAEDPRAAIDAYELAERSFQESVELAPDFKDSADYYRALAALGSGFAHLLVNERAEAAERLVAGIAIRPSIADVRDPLDREAVDLLDGALEWRRGGPSPVDALELTREFLRVDPGNTQWARRISDSELREGLRSDGRANPELGDRQLERSIAVARLAQGEVAADEDRRALAQALSVHAERMLARARLDLARPLLSEAAQLISLAGVASGAPEGEWFELAARLRLRLGEARPIFRPGR